MHQAVKFLLAGALLGLSACGREAATQPGFPQTPISGAPGYYDPGQGNTLNPMPTTPQPGLPAEGKTYTVLKNVFLRMDPELGVLVKNLEGQLVPNRSGDPVIFDDVNAFTTHVSRAEIIIDDKNITTLKNKYTFNFAYRYPMC